MTDILVGGVILAVLGAIIFYLVRARRGQKCIGCPYGGKCSGNCSSAKNQHQ